ncbi:MAG: four-carbon acid sugar kinase family protein [Spirochaetales bacterium]
MTLQELLSPLPSPRSVLNNRTEIRTILASQNKKLVVVDDDPTGTQTVHGIRVYMDWSIETLVKALNRPDEVFYISTNSRALGTEEMTCLCIELGNNLRKATQIVAEKTGKSITPLLASRSDSTLRGHFPEEIDALLQGYGEKVDGIILAPALFEAGRYTIDDVHYVDLGDRVLPAAETEFAKDPAFGYTKSNLKEWVEEKTRGRWKASEILSLSLFSLRVGGVKSAVEVLRRAKNGVPIVVNAASYEDLETAVLALTEAENQGKTFAYRCAACFVKVRGGFVDRPLLSSQELGTAGGAGLVVVGSYVGKTGRQLDQLLNSIPCKALELQVDTLAQGEEAASKEVTRVVTEANTAINKGLTVVVFTSRTVRQAEGKAFLEFGHRVMMCLCKVVQDISTRPSFVVAKGGITSIEIARTGMRVKEAYVPGQIAKGVPLWQLGPEAKWPGIPYVVFPGNVGDDYTLAQVVQTLKG